MTNFERFLIAHPEYASTQALDDLRTKEYARLAAEDHTYLDYTGASLHAEAQVRDHIELLNHHVFGNPHSASPTSTAMTSLVERARRSVLAHFNAADDYTAIFTLNASAALKLIGESFPFEPGGQLLLTTDNHNSVNGIREFADSRGARTHYAPLTMPDLRVDRPAMEALLDAADSSHPNLFAFPAQSNFTGVKHPLDLVADARERGWQVLLDAAAFVPTNRLDLQAVSPDFVALSFYKMFGYPTGVGCLLVRKSAIEMLERPWFAGGTVNFATVTGRRRLLSPGEAGFEDGTVNYLSIPAVEIGLRHLERVGIERLQIRLRCLTAWLLSELLALTHTNDRHLVRIYGPADTESRGATVTMNFYDPHGHLLDYRRVEELAGHHRISVRTGCFCNPGAGETAEGLTEDDIDAGIETATDLTLPKFMQVLQQRGGKSAGAFRVSLGIASNFADVDRFLQFVASLRDQTSLAIGAVTFDIESCRVIRDGS